jgi:hypothetical protein
MFGSITSADSDQLLFRVCGMSPKADRGTGGGDAALS